MMQYPEWLIKAEISTYKNFKNLKTNPLSRFSKLLVVDYAGYKLSRNCRFHYWLCLCDCGEYKLARTSHLVEGGIKKCDFCPKIGNSITHGMSKSEEYNIWSHIKARCYNQKNSAYKHYGGRGIKMCERWLESFENFYEDIGPRPGPEYSVDRIDINGNYSKINCRWATDVEQMNNTRVNLILIYKGKQYTAKELAKIAGFSYTYFTSRLKTMSIEDAVENKIISKKILQLDITTKQIIQEFDSISSAAKTLALNKDAIRNCANKRQHTSQGFIWRFSDDIEKD